MEPVAAVTRGVRRATGWTAADLTAQRRTLEVLTPLRQVLEERHDGPAC
jgi:hypothetical protein